MRYGTVASKQKIVGTELKKQICCSISGGRTSAYMALKLVELYGKENVAFIFTDTGAEHPKTYQFLRDISEQYGIKITCLRLIINPELGKANSHLEVDLSECKHDLQPWKDACSKYGTPYLGGPFCTRTMKLEVFNRYCNATFGSGNYHTWLGIRSDEPKRLKKRDGISYLADIDDAEKPDVLAFWKEQPIDLQIPEYLGNCVFCIKKGLNKIALAARDEPELLIQFLNVIESPSVRTVERRQQENKIMYRDNMSLRSIVETYKDHSREEIAATIRGMKGEDTGSCSESCEAMLDETPPQHVEIEVTPDPEPSLLKHRKAMPAEANKSYQRPFLKWAGGKYSQLADLQQYIPAGKRLIEPFVGGGSVFMNSSKHSDFLLADVNADLINLYQMLSVVPEDVVREARLMFDCLNTPEGYSAIRDEFNAQRQSGPERAAAFLYLNRHCFNGLIRYNRAGNFNVGWGKYRAPYFPEEEIEAFTEMSHNCVFMNTGFERTLSLASAGDVVYCDPPYEPLPGTAGFTSYAAGGFNWDAQVRLAGCCVAANQRGARIVISNAAVPRVIELYQQYGFSINRVKARRSISSKGVTREIVTDILAIL